MRDHVGRAMHRPGARRPGRSGDSLVNRHGSSKPNNGGRSASARARHWQWARGSCREMPARGPEQPLREPSAATQGPGSRPGPRTPRPGLPVLREGGEEFHRLARRAATATPATLVGPGRKGPSTGSHVVLPGPGRIPASHQRAPPVRVVVKSPIGWTGHRELGQSEGRPVPSGPSRLTHVKIWAENTGSAVHMWTMRSQKRREERKSQKASLYEGNP